MFLIKQNNIKNNDNILYLEGLSWDFDIINKDYLLKIISQSDVTTQTLTNIWI